MDSAKPGPKISTNTFGFVDEIGLLNTPDYDQIFGIGFLKLNKLKQLHTTINRLRDKLNYYDEFKFADISNYNLNIYKQILKIYFSLPETYFSCVFINKKAQSNIKNLRNRYTETYNKLVAKLVCDSLDTSEYIAVLADDISRPKKDTFESDMKDLIKKKTRRNALFGICRVDSKSVSEIQMTDLLLGIVGYAYKLKYGLVSVNRKNAKFKLVKVLQKHLNIDYLAESEELRMRNGRVFIIGEYKRKINADGALN